MGEKNEDLGLSKDKKSQVKNLYLLVLHKCKALHLIFFFEHKCFTRQVLQCCVGVHWMANWLSSTICAVHSSLGLIFQH